MAVREPTGQSPLIHTPHPWERVALGAIIVGLFTAAGSVRLREFWGDGATYVSMAWSLAEDADLRYEVKDLLRVRREFPSGPEGIFLKRASGGLAWDPAEGFPWMRLRRVPADAPRVYFAKPYAYPVAAAPLVAVFGIRGLLFTNALFFSMALLLGYAELRRHGAYALPLVIVLFLGTVAPLYLFWPTPEVFNLGVVTAGLVTWRRGRPLLSAVLLGLATYSKPYNLWLAIPLGLAPLLGWWDAEKGTGQPSRFWRRLLESLRRGAVLAGTTLALFGLNAAITGEWNYQGGAERKTFYGAFPGERRADGTEVTFGNSGIWMTVKKLGPKVEGMDATRTEQGAEPPRSAAELRMSFLYNLVYFWIGRFGGAGPYFPAGFLALLAFVLIGPRGRTGWLALFSLVVSAIFYITMIPDNWYGGSGTVGNRYFLNLLPLTLLLVPRGRELAITLGGLALTALFGGSVLLSPIHHSLYPGHHALRQPFQLLPAELTMLNDLSIFSERWRWKRPIGDTEGDAHRRWPADPKAYYLYFPDDGTFGREEALGGTGFWLRGGAHAEVFLRALEPVRRMTFQVTGGPLGDRIRLRVGSREERLEIAPDATREAVLEAGRPFVYKDSFVYVLRLSSTRGGPTRDPSGRERNVGGFVRIALDVAPRRPVKPQSDQGGR